MKRRVLIVQPSMQPPGGGNGVAAWILQALVGKHQVTVLTWQPVEIDAINRFYGTDIARSQFDTIVVPRTWRFLPDLLPVPAALLKSALLMRYTRRVSDGFDVVFGASNETDFGRRGIQYIHYPTYLRPRPEVDYRWYHQWARALRAYYRVADRLSGFSKERLRRNLSLVNSNWTGRHVRHSLGIEARTLYPPVAEPSPGLPWSQRRTAFLAVGRISSEKEYERVMRILARVRAHVPELTLTIVGTWDRRSRAYYREVQRLARALGPWIEIRENLPRAEVRALMAAYRYGIHGMQEEHFGMAPAEIMRAGAIVWVPRSGGQVEIVGDEPLLTYDTEEEAAENILRVIRDPGEQERLRAYLDQRSELFGAERFVEHVRAIVADFKE